LNSFENDFEEASSSPDGAGHRPERRES